MFVNREEAGRRLAEALKKRGLDDPLVLAIPRGAVPMARVIAEHLGGDLDVVLVHKLGAPGNPEFAIGAVDEEGHASVGDWARQLGIDEGYVRAEADRQSEALRSRRQRYTPVRSPIPRAGRTVVVVDDGVATGSTMKSALESVRKAGADRVIAAMAVAPPDAVNMLNGVADEVVCLDTPSHFQAVGQFFRDFRQVDDDEVIAVLRAFKGGP
ncbi:phosphoribosyltransferase [Ectothiorhodospiraceae bacterium WFHF3C12]|nr:phosphoribosyltransferase [Ectothiorhodospiraceae bacterium WFHF3C12]